MCGLKRQVTVTPPGLPMGAKLSSRLALVLNLLLGAMMGGVVLAARASLPTLFTSDAAIRSVVRKVLYVIGAYQVTAFLLVGHGARLTPWHAGV